MKKYILLAGLVFGLPACDLLINPCGRDNPATFYDVQGIGIVVIRLPANRPMENVSAGASVASQELLLRLNLQERYYTARPTAGFLSAAYACSPAEPGSKGSAELVDSLSVTSAYNYDAAHPAGTSLLDIFGPRVFAQPAPSRQAPQEPFRSVDLGLRTLPAASGPQQFRVYYRQTNGEVYTAETVVFSLTR